MASNDKRSQASAGRPGGRWTAALAALPLAWLATCNAGTTPPAAGVSVAVHPPSAQVVTGGEMPFSAAVAGTANTQVIWTVLEPGAGSIDASGAFVASATPGTFHVVATSAADPSKSGTAVVVVAAPPAGALDVWVVAGMDRVFRDDPVGPSKGATVLAARGEFEPFQVAIRAPPGGLTNVNVQASALSGPSTIAASNLALYFERYVHVAYRSYWAWSTSPIAPATAPRDYPDVLVPFTVAGKANAAAAPFAVAGGTNQPIWVDLFVPYGTPAGNYTGSVTVSSDQGSATVPVSLTVWDFALPVKPSLRSAFGIQFGAETKTAYERILVDHKVMPTPTAPAVAKSLVTAGTGLTMGDLQVWSHQSGCTLDPPPSVASLSSLAASYPAGLDLYVYVADEPRNQCSDMTALYPQLVSWSLNIHAAGVKTLLTLPPVPALLDDGTGRSAIDIWPMLPSDFARLDPAALQTARDKGNEIWSYTALVQDSYSPAKWEIDYPPLVFRMMPGFMSQSLDLTGILYWAVNWWKTDPFDVDYVCCGGYHYAGEGVLIYPGDTLGVPGGVVPSIRLKWIRKGVEDYEYVQLLKGLGQGSSAMNVSRGVASAWNTWTKDPAAVAGARVTLGQQLDLLHPSGP